MPSKKLKGGQLKFFRKQVARLKNMGLVSKRVDARSQKSTRYMREQVEKRFAKVLSGEAVAVKVPRRKFLEDFKIGFETKFNRVVVPIEKGARRPHFSTKTGAITGDVELNGKHFQRVYTPVTAENVHKLKKGKNVRYTVKFIHGYEITADNLPDLERLLFPYTTAGGAARPWDTWRNYVLIDTLKGDKSDYSDEDI